MSNRNQAPLRLHPAPDSSTVELLYRTFGDVLIPLDRLREQYFRNLNEERFFAEINSGRIQLPITRLDNSRKSTKFAHIRHVAALIDTCAYKADEGMPGQSNESSE